MSKNLYIVLHDFTEIGDTALEYALHIAENVHTDIELLHVVNNSSKEAAAKAKLQEIIDRCTLPSGCSLSPVVKTGNFIDDMGQMVKNEHAQLVIMGTHGALGLQKLFGSHALKMIRNAEVPFLVVQKGTPLRNISKVIVPVDLTKESLQIVNVAGDMANIFGGEVHIVYEDPADDRSAMTMKTRTHIVKTNYEERGVKAEFVKLPTKGSYIKKIEQYAEANSAEANFELTTIHGRFKLFVIND